MYGKDESNRKSVELEMLVACPTCGAKKGEACARGGQTTGDPHNKRALAAAKS